MAAITDWKNPRKVRAHSMKENPDDGQQGDKKANKEPKKKEGSGKGEGGASEGPEGEALRNYRKKTRNIQGSSL